MACNKIVWAFVGLFGLSLFMALSAAAPGVTGGGEVGVTGGGKAGVTGGVQAGGNGGQGGKTTTPAPQHDGGKAGGKEKPSEITVLLRTIVGDVVKALPNRFTGIFFARLRTDVITKIIREHRDAVKRAINKFNANDLKKAVDGFSQKQLQDIFGADAEKVKKLSPEALKKKILKLKAGKLALFAKYESKKFLGRLIKSLPASVIGKAIINHFAEFLNVVKAEDLIRILSKIFKIFLGHFPEDKSSSHATSHQ